MKIPVFAHARACLIQTDIREKVRETTRLRELWLSGSLGVVSDKTPITNEPGMPDTLLFVDPVNLPRRSLHNTTGHAAFIHALVHIEFSAINLALDVIVRFRDLPRKFYADWIKVAAEEAMHFEMLSSRLNNLGHDYGDFPVHNGLWDTAEKTAHDLLLRLALVPRMLEARGLDVTPAMINRLREVKDFETAGILEKILRDEEDHVRTGSNWFNYICAERGLDSHSTFIDLIRANAGNQIRLPINFEARKRAGFSQEELSQLDLMTK